MVQPRRANVDSVEVQLEIAQAQLMDLKQNFAKVEGNAKVSYESELTVYEQRHQKVKEQETMQFHNLIKARDTKIARLEKEVVAKEASAERRVAEVLNTASKQEERILQEKKALEEQLSGLKQRSKTGATMNKEQVLATSSEILRLELDASHAQAEVEHLRIASGVLEYEHAEALKTIDSLRAELARVAGQERIANSQPNTTACLS